MTRSRSWRKRFRGARLLRGCPCRCVSVFRTRCVGGGKAPPRHAAARFARALTYTALPASRCPSFEENGLFFYDTTIRPIKPILDSNPMRIVSLQRFARRCQTNENWSKKTRNL